jgi:hypothetical protein
VWSNGPSGDRDVVGATFEVPDIDDPVIDCEAADTNWHADNVTLHCTAEDVGRAGLANPGDASFDLVTTVPAGEEWPNVDTDSREVCDAATPQNCVTAGPIGGNKIDRRGPWVGVTAPASGASFALNQVVAADYDCQDDGAGLQSCVGSVGSGQPIDTSSPGPKTFQVTSTDHIGNTTVVNVPYTVAGALPTFAGLIAQVQALPVSALTRAALVATLRAAERAAGQGRVVLARALLEVFVFDIRVLVALNRVPADVGNDLINQAQALAAVL